MSRPDDAADRAAAGRLEQALVRFVDATLLHDDLPAARLAFADAQALGLAEVGREAELWAALELRAADGLPDDLDDEDQADRVLRGLSRGGAT